MSVETIAIPDTSRARSFRIPPALAAMAILGLASTALADSFAAPLPAGVRAVWTLDSAFREATPTRERISINGLWRWQPADPRVEQPPSSRWGFFKVPGSWPGITDYMQKDSQTVFAHPDWTNRNFAGISAAWHEREITVPTEWAGRRIELNLEYLNSYALVLVDGKRAGEIRFPAGNLDITALCRAGATHRLSLLVVALPLKSLMTSYVDSAAAREVTGSVPRRGLCGDVFLTSTPIRARMVNPVLGSSVRKKEFSFGATMEGLAAENHYRLQARVMDRGRKVKEFIRTFAVSDLKNGRIEFTEKWMPDRLWDTHTPQNPLDVELSLLDAAGKTLDRHWGIRFAAREFWIEGRDFVLNGKRIHLSAVPLDNAQVGAALSTYDGARESLERLKSFGINYVYTHNYSCEPGSHVSFEEILRAADDVGMLVGLTQPHFSHYDWQAPDADVKNGYAAHAAFYARVAGAHPSVVMYAMSHNATGYSEDMNPDLIDGLHDPRDSWATKNVKLALRAEAIVKDLDPSRIIYHHASGNLGSMHAINFYPNFVPVQELSDWFGHWSTTGIKPVFTCEYGAPFTWDWTMYRGWYQGQREFGSARVPWEYCIAEWNAQFFGDAAYRISQPEKANLRWEAGQFKAGNVWHRWDYPNQVGSPRFEECDPVFALYLKDNWRAFRTWGVSAVSPWEYGRFWKLREGVDHKREEFKVDWDHLQRPGFSADYAGSQFERMDIAFKRDDWIPTEAAEALLRNNQPTLAYIAGKADQFTAKNHNFFPGQQVEKQMVVINDSRETLSCDSRWSFNAGNATGSRRLTVAPGSQARFPFHFKVPAETAPGRYELAATFKFSDGTIQTDSFSIDVLPPAAPAQSRAKIAVFDPRGETSALLKSLGLGFENVQVNADLRAYDIFVVGKGALTVDGPAPDIGRVRDGLKAILFEQTADVLEKRFGFRVEEYGLRNVFRRIPDHPVFAGLAKSSLQDWSGAATLLPPQLSYEMRPRYGPTVQWSGLPVTRLWRCGNRGNVASVLIEKPARGDFLPIIDGGYSLQYSPLLEYREGSGMVVFCQMDVCGRTETDPAAMRLAQNLLAYAANWKPSLERKAVYVGDPVGKKYFDAAEVTTASYEGTRSGANQVLLIGPGGGRLLGENGAADWVKSGGRLLAIGIGPDDVAAFSPLKISFKTGEHISTFFDPPAADSVFAGIGPADLHNRGPRNFPLVTAGAQIVGDGILASTTGAGAVFSQLAPWQFEGSAGNLRRTHRRTSVLLARLLGNLGVRGSTPLLQRFRQPVLTSPAEQRWRTGFYLDEAQEWDDPYRFFRW